MPPPIPDRNRVMARICHFYSCGYRMQQIAGLPGMPCIHTIWTWAKASATFRSQLKEARVEGRFLRRQSEAFDPNAVEPFLAKVRAGRAVSRLVKEPEGPHRELLDRWLRAHPDFAAAFAEAKRIGAPRLRKPRKPFDEALADRIMLRTIRGETLTQLYRDPALPGMKVLRRWRALDPDFDRALRSAIGIGRGRRRLRLSLTPCTAKVTDRIARRVILGDSLRSLGGARGMPSARRLYRWMRIHPEFAAAVNQARELSAQRRQDLALARALEAYEGGEAG